MRSDTPRGRWFERAMREQMSDETVNRITVICTLNPYDRDTAIDQLSDGELVFFCGVLSDPGTAIAEHLRSGRIRIDPPDARIILRSEVLAEIGAMREIVFAEIQRRIDETADV